MNIIQLVGNSWYRLDSTLLYAGFKSPDENAPVLKSYVEINKDFGLDIYSWGEYIFVSEKGGKIWDRDINIHDVEPFVKIEVIGNAYHKNIETKVRSNLYGWNRPYKEETKYVLDTYGGTYDYYNKCVAKPGIPWNYLKLKISDDKGSQEVEMKFKRPNTGTAIVSRNANFVTLEYDFFGCKLSWEEKFEPALKGWHKVYSLLKNFEIKSFKTDETGPMVLWRCYFNYIGQINVDNKGVVGAEKKKGIKENLTKLEEEEPVIWKFYQWLHNSSMSGGVSNNNLLTAFLKKCGSSYKDLRDSLYNAMTDIDNMTEPPNYYYSYEKVARNRGLCMMLPGAKNKQEEKLSKTQWQFQKGLEKQADALGIDSGKYPKLFKAVKNNDIPLSIFHDPGDKESLINIEFSLWEKALNRKGWSKIIYDIANKASGRKAYEKNITPYISFLFKIEKYLDKHTPRGKKWKAFPKLVESQWELEMDEADEGGTTKKRSALTPIADNDTRTITVPYAALAVYGRRTTYCYSLNYYVFEENVLDPESETPIVNELEEKLNGRDDYGLMYYTLTGSITNRGYPAFLIIFERLSDKTRVHFHRVHPSRLKNGKKVPACQLIEECYRYMAGNIRAEEIHAQQGDLIFIKKDSGMDFSEGRRVAAFESHAFKPINGPPLLLLENTAKSIKNRLGFLCSETSFKVDHPEHEPLNNMPPGIYEVRRCKSWEANPQVVWSLTID